jgi:hypothetical protein
MAESTANNEEDDDYMADLSRFLPSDSIIQPPIPKSSSKRVIFSSFSVFKIHIRFSFSVETYDAYIMTLFCLSIPFRITILIITDSMITATYAAHTQ